MRKPKKKKTKPAKPAPTDYVLFPSVTNPQGRVKAFSDAFKAAVRFSVENFEKPAAAYANDKTERIVTEENLKILSHADRDEWNTAYDEFEALSLEQQQAWTHHVLTTYPKLEELPDLDLYNLIN